VHVGALRASSVRWPAHHWWGTVFRRIHRYV